MSDSTGSFINKVLMKISRSKISEGRKEPFSPASPESVESYNKVYEDIFTYATGNRTDDHVPYKESLASDFQNHVKLIAFYLPQFHPIPENDAWWGKGFTEWTNVSKAIPQFLGHYQPRLPGELGFYDLRLPEIQEQQVQLAKNYGIYGFCFYYYWFGGKRLLHKPLDQFVDNQNINFPFCICWANENWTRRWDGKEDDVLIQQKHSLENDKNFIHDALPYLLDNRYIRINGRPLIIVYRTSLLKNPLETAKAWRRVCLDHGAGNPYLVAAQTFGFYDPRPIGFDAAVEFPPHNIPYKNIVDQVTLVNKNYTGAVYSYIEMVQKNIEPLKNLPYRVFRTACPSWDNEPRKPGNGNSFIYSTPRLYSHWMKQLSFAEIMKQPEGEQYVFINSWNEWGEGANLEPDRRFGYAYLQATSDALLDANSLQFSRKHGTVGISEVTKNYDTAVIMHLYYMDLLEEFKDHLKNIGDFDLYVSIPKSHKNWSNKVFNVFPDANIFYVENQGRDIAPFLSIINLIRNLDYVYLLKLHTKKSQHRQDGDAWRNDILAKLTGSAKIVNNQRNPANEYTNWNYWA